MSLFEISGEQAQFYGESASKLTAAADEIISIITNLQNAVVANNMRNPVEHYKARIKSVDSMKRKLIKNGLKPNAYNALHNIYDAAGIRVVCTFLDDVYLILNLLKQQKQIETITEKDYIKNPKPNGYRSYHMIVKLSGIFVEIQLRTIAMDCWASLEHQLKYKREINNQSMIVEELKRCADEIASTDVTLQTIRDLIDDPQPVFSAKAAVTA